METPKQKAAEIRTKMYSAKGEDGFYRMTLVTAKNCAKIAVEELIKESSDRTTTIRFKG